MVKKIHFRISPLGEVQMDIEGALGTECDAISAPFESVLGTISDKTRKDSFFSVRDDQEITAHQDAGGKDAS